MKRPLAWKEAKDIHDFKRGCIVSSVANPSKAYLVVANYGDRATAVDSVDITNPCEWLILEEDK